MRSAKKIFEEELSGEPLSQDSVVLAIQIAQEEVIKRSVIIAEIKYAQWLKEWNGKYPRKISGFKKVKKDVKEHLKSEI